MILAGDIGGTHARLALVEAQNGHLRVTLEDCFPSRQYAGLDDIVLQFAASQQLPIETACFGVAGPVRDGRCITSNLPWKIESRQLASTLKLAGTLLINDLEASAWGISALQPEDFVNLNPGLPEASGNQAIIAAGTGLGEAGLYWDGQRYRVFACEGGHTDFAPCGELEIELLRYLTKKFGRVSYERVLSGPGLVNIFEFLRDTGRGNPPQWLADEMNVSDPAPCISRAALDGRCGLSEKALEIFVSIYGAEAGNLALKMMATGGLFVGGGIAPKILPALVGPIFRKAFLEKGRMHSLMESVPVRVITNNKTALLGAARCAAARTAQASRS